MIRLQIGNYTETQRAALYRMFVAGLTSLNCPGTEKPTYCAECPYHIVCQDMGSAIGYLAEYKAKPG